MRNISPVAKVTILALVFVCFTVWLLSVTNKHHPSLDNKSHPISNQSSIEIEANPIESKQSIEGIKENQIDLQTSNDKFQVEYLKMVTDGSLESIISYQQDFDNFLTDAKLLHDDAIASYKSCIANSTDITVDRNCFGARWALNSSWAHFGIENTLRQLPNVSLADVSKSNLQWTQTISSHMSNVKSTLYSIEDNPELARKCSISAESLGSVVEKAQELEDRATSVRNEDPILIWILQSHADILLNEFNLKTFKYLTMVDNVKVTSLPAN